jgi:hypothetical protein
MTMNFINYDVKAEPEGGKPGYVLIKIERDKVWLFITTVKVR